MLRINVIIDANGEIIGKTVSDRWNLSVLGLADGKLVDATGKPRRATMAGLRRLAKSLDCSIIVHRKATEVARTASKQEREALGARLARLFKLAA